jgi:serine protease Do
MNKETLHILMENVMKLHHILAAFLLLGATELQAHTIRLKNGKLIQSNNVWKEGNNVIYEKYGGNITISGSEVQDIVYTKSKQTEERPPEGSNLSDQLRAKLNPKSPVEEASLRTLAVKTITGFGSGFFISDKGYIITNKHVVRGDEQENQQINKQINRATQEFGEYEQELERFRENNERNRKELRQQRELLKEAERKGWADDRQIALRKKELDLFEEHLQSDEERYDREHERYSGAKENVDLKVAKFREGQELQGRQDVFEVILADGTKLYATLCKISQDNDLALLKVEGYVTPRFESAKRSELSQGEEVFAIGSPLDLNLKNTVTSGVLSGFRDNFIQTNAQIYPGNSGGPLINKEGKVIGVNTMKLLTRNFEGLGFAIPIETVYAEFDKYLY